MADLDTGPRRGPRGLTGAQGTAGKDGQSITGPAGVQGPAGKDGIGIKGDKGDQGERGLAGPAGQSITGPIGLTGPAGKDGQSIVGPPGPQGVKGDSVTGPQGAAGVSITGSTVNANGNLILSLSNGTTVDAGVVRGAVGATGPAGQSIVGPQGEPGTPALVRVLSIPLPAIAVNAHADVAVSLSPALADANYGIDLTVQAIGTNKIMVAGVVSALTASGFTARVRNVGLGGGSTADRLIVTITK